MRYLVQRLVNFTGYEVRKLREPEPPINHAALKLGAPEPELYTPLFSPWLSKDFRQAYEKIRPYTLVDEQRSHVLQKLATQATRLGGEVWECGVYRGGTAMLLSDVAADATLRLFDTFEGMPEVDTARDCHRAGDFADTNVESVRQRVPRALFHKGFIPDTFAGLEDSQIAFAHVDVDLYRSVLDCCRFIYPRLLPGGFLIFDDYGFPTCFGARQAVDEFFLDKPEVPLVLPTGQALVFKAARTAR